MKSISRAKLIIVVGLALSCIGCLPRGETRSLDQILSDSKARYSSVQSHLNTLNPEVAQRVSQIASSMDALLKAPTGASQSSAAATADGALMWLAAKSGYTSRPAMSEVASQWRAISAVQGGAADEARVKLLVARTYSLVASELETTKFGL